MGLKEIYEMARKKGLHILIVEDDSDLALEFKELLEELDFQVDIACDGAQALNMYTSYYNEKQKYYDIVISDINMPFMNGVELVTHILKKNSNQVIIIVSANKDSEQLIPLINMRVEQFIKKPIVLNEFINSLDNALRKLIKVSETRKPESGQLVKLGSELFWNEEDALLLYQDEYVKLTQNEQKVLKLMLSTPHRVYSKEEICHYLENDEVNVEIVKHLILRLRKKIPKELIESVYGVGYKAVY